MSSPPQQLDGIFKFPGHKLADDYASITIDAAYLLKRPFLTNKTTYADLGRQATSLSLIAIEEEEVGSILPLFTALRHLILQEITIRNQQFLGLPTEGIESLQLIDCKITTDVITKSFRSMGKSLLRVQIERCSHAVQHIHEGSFVDLLDNLPDSVQFLSVYDPICTIINRHVRFPPNLTYFHLETPREWTNGLLPRIAKCGSKIQTLIFKVPEIDSDSIRELRKIKNLQHLRILNSVDSKGRARLKSLRHLKTLEVHCYSPPAQKNLILTLNDDCLMHVLSFLHQSAFLAMALAHPRFYRLVTRHIYPREEIEVDDSWEEEDVSFSQKQEEIILKSWEQHATSVRMTVPIRPKLILSRCKKLHTLALSSIPPNYSFHEIPNGIKKLYLDLPKKGDSEYKFGLPYFSKSKRYKYGSEGSETDSDESEDEEEEQENEPLGDLFHRLRTSLTSLTLRGDFKPSDLSELRSLREFRVEDWKSNGAELVEILRNNENTLELLDVIFDEYALLSSRPKRLSLCPLKNLKALNLHDINCQIDLKHFDYPSLEEIRMSFDSKLPDSIQGYIMKSIKQFVQLKTLITSYLSLEDLIPLKNLEFLGMFEYPDDLLDMLKKMPKLSKLKWDGPVDFELEFKLRNFLIAEKRTLRFHNVYDVVMP